MPDHHRQRPLWQVTLVLSFGGLLAILFIWLGFWQIERLAWKRDLIDRVQTNLAAEPVPLNTVLDIAPEDLEFRPVHVSGVFDHTAETFTKAVTELGGGYWVITPLHVGDGQTVLINRGFVPPNRRDQTTRQDELIDGPVTVTGLVRLSEPKGGFLRDNDPQADLWYSRDVAAIARARALAPTASIFVDAEASANSPIGGLTVVKFRNTHLIYAVTWFALAVLVVCGMAFVIHHERKLR